MLEVRPGQSCRSRVLSAQATPPGNGSSRRRRIDEGDYSCRQHLPHAILPVSVPNWGRLDDRGRLRGALLRLTLAALQRLSDGRGCAGIAVDGWRRRLRSASAAVARHSSTGAANHASPAPTSTAAHAPSARHVRAGPACIAVTSSRRDLWRRRRRRRRAAPALYKATASRVARLSDSAATANSRFRYDDSS